MTDLNSKIFLQTEFDYFYNSLKEIRDSKSTWKYSLIPDEEYKKIEDPIDSGHIYWREMLYRVHCTVIVSFLKSIRWIDAFRDAQKSGNYYSYITNLRGFIESTADSFYTLRFVNLTIAKDFDVILKILNKTSFVIIDHQKLEDSLIHFTHAARVEERIERNVPKHFSAKQIKQYLESISDPEDSLYSLYSHLSSIAHPTGYSNMLVLTHDHFDLVVTNDTKQREINLISEIAETSLSDIHKIFKILCTCGFLALKLINKFNLPDIKTNFGFEQFLSSMDAWKEMEEYIIASSELYRQAELTGKYE